MYISSVVHLQENIYKVAVWIYSILSRLNLQKNRYKIAVSISHHVFTCRKVDKSWGTVILSRAHLHER